MTDYLYTSDDVQQVIRDRFEDSLSGSYARALLLTQQIGLIGDSHGDAEFLMHAARALTDAGCTSLVQLGDFGMIWSGTRREAQRLSALNDVLAQLDVELNVVLGNHENYDLIETIPADWHGHRRLFSHVRLLSPSGVAHVPSSDPEHVHVLGWLAGAASIDRSVRVRHESWWPQEVVSDEQAQGLLQASSAPGVIFAHEAMAMPGLLARLGLGDGWDRSDLVYAGVARHQHTSRVLSVLDPDTTTLVVSGHYHFAHSETAELMRMEADGSMTPILVHQEVLDMQWRPASLGVLDLAGTEPIFTTLSEVKILR